MSARQAVVLVNLGTPDGPDAASVRRYLKEFLSDPRVVEAPRFVWWCVLSFFILPFRPRRVARLYQGIWRGDSPMRLISSAQADALASRLSLPVRSAMTYGRPALGGVLDELMVEGIDSLLVLPLYPQYSGSTTGAVSDALCRWLMRQRELPSFHLLHEYWQEDAWLDAMAASISAFREEHGAAERLLFSFHGIPVAYQEKGDRYGERCLASAMAIAERLGLAEGEWQAAFQSRFGPQPWLQPYTDDTLRDWAAGGIRSVQVVCPGFAADCLETLEEIAVENRDLFLSAGGKTFQYIPALNDENGHIEALAELCRKVLPR